MSFDDPKEFQGRPYSGMMVGAAHDWDYRDARWRERKATPDRWEVRFSASKHRRRWAPEKTGAAPGTCYHWFILGHQRVRKVDANTYQTLLEGTKWKVGHRRPHWRKWSSEYPEQPSARLKLIDILEQALLELRDAEAEREPSIEASLSPLPAPPWAMEENPFKTFA